MEWGTLVTATLQLYRQAAVDTWQRIQRNWWVSLLPLLYGVLLLFAIQLVLPLGMPGGFILGLISAMCTSSYLYFVAGTVNGQRMFPSDLMESWRPYLGPVITILFFLFIVQMLLRFALPPVAASRDILFIIQLVLMVILNPIPEIIYLGRSEGLGMLQESVEFLRESGLEWFLPLVLLTLFSIILPVPFLVSPFQVGQLSLPPLSAAGLLGSLTGLVQGILSAVFLFVLMVFRGLLFRSLASGTRRQRIFRARLS
ncbi:MAG: hypothetical protein AB7G75_35420 [Candidatus Binatia bacterium]